jgi:hypothetical protein
VVGKQVLVLWQSSHGRVHKDFERGIDMLGLKRFTIGSEHSLVISVTFGPLSRLCGKLGVVFEAI